jgi:hypothetical protein
VTIAGLAGTVTYLLVHPLNRPSASDARFDVILAAVPIGYAWLGRLITGYDPPGRVVFEVRMGKMQPTTTFTIAPQGQGCRITRRIDMEPQGMMRVMAPFVGGMMRKRNAGFLATLKRTLEADRIDDSR